VSGVLDEHVDEEELSGLLDGEVAPARAGELRAHLEGCAACAETYDELARLRAAARDLAPAAPPAGLFERVLAEVAPASLPARGQRAQPVRRRRWLMPAAAAVVLSAAAAVVLLMMPRRSTDASGLARTLLGAVVDPGPGPGPGASDDEIMAAAMDEIARGEEHYTRAIGELKRLVVRERVKWTPAVAASFDQSLREIDQAVARTREMARRAPGDADSQDALVAAYRREVDFLEEMIVRGPLGGQDL